MNLLTDQWIPVRLLKGSGTVQKIALSELLCGGEEWELCLPRDDMELAAMQLLICMVQALLTPKDGKGLLSRIARPIAAEEYDAATRDVADWFVVDHPQQPFMQVRGVAAKDPTPMDKLLAGVTGATNSCFVNQAGLADGLCGGCVAIALFNQASCAPSFGGGFKAGLRGSSPITTLGQGDHLRRTVWLNVLSDEELMLDQNFPWHRETASQKPTWIEPIKVGETIPAQWIGVIRGLLWQPAHIELLPPVPAEACSCCGCKTDIAYTGFNKAKFNYTVSGTWPHPHSPRIMTSKKGEIEQKFAAFTTTAPAWTQLSRFVLQQQIDKDTEGQQPAAVILQSRKILPPPMQTLHLLVGGYRNNQASVLERRHEVFTLNHGWDKHTKVINDLVTLGQGYRDALVKKALYVFINGVTDVKGARLKLAIAVDAQFYRRSEPTIEDTLARIDFADPAPELTRMRAAFKAIATELFEETTRPYLNDPQLIHTLAVAKRTLYKHLNNLEPQQNKGGDDGTAETP
ncbi:MAG: type I-E CRISPR-associated protein Cse1/CasA [Geobacter sp.]|nr:type I-E CRISPR-associated protein Cse1/CasA [Geobacter sp.]